LGAERLIHGFVGKEPVVVRTDEVTSPPAIGTSLKIVAQTQHMHEFDAATGLRVDPSS